MKDQVMTKEQQIEELTALRRRVADLKESQDEIKQAEKALQKSEQDYRAFFEGAIDGMVVVDAETMQIVLANEAVVKLYGFDSLEDIVGASPLDFIPPEDRERLVRIMAEDMFEKDLRQINEFRAITRDGREIWVEAVGTRIEYQGRLAGLASFRDITERKRVEESLRRSEEKYRSLVEGSHAGIAASDLEGRVTFVNKSLCQMIGYSRDELLGRHFSDFLHPDDRQRMLDLLHESLAASRDVVNVQFRLIHKKGYVVHVYASPTAIREDSNIVGSNAVITDISDRVQAEEALRRSCEYLDRIINGMFDAVMVVDLNYQIRDVNNRFLELYGVTREEATQLKCYQATHRSWRPCSEDMCPCPVEFVMKTKSPASVEHVHRAGKRGKVTVELYAFPFSGQEGQAEHVVVIAHDITEHKRKRKRGKST